MTFSHIIRKNFIHNFNKYISFYFVNSLIIAMIFIYGSLLYNQTIINDMSESNLYKTIKMALVGIILFSIIFITYTNISFFKNRGKEFGMYLTLGMTIRDLTKLIFIENIGIMITSMLTGVLTGTLFGRLFYMGLNKILMEKNIEYNLNYKSFLLSIGVFFIIFLGNFIFNIIYIRRVSIIDAIKSDKKKEIGRTNLLIGILSLLVLVVSIYCLPKTLIKDIFREEQYMLSVFVILILVCPYMIIGASIGLVRNVLRKFPKIYNRNLLVLSNLSHRFLGYKNVLYMLCLMIGGAIFFVGFSYAQYTSIRADITVYHPYDIMFIETNEYNKVEKETVKNIINKNNGKVEKYNVLEYIKVPMLWKEDSKLGFYKNQHVISETNYNKHMETNVDIKENEAINITIHDEKIAFENPPSTILASMNEKQLDEVNKIITSENGPLLSQEEFEKITKGNAKVYLNEENIKKETNVPFRNIKNLSNYNLGVAFVIDDKEYDNLKTNLTDKSINNIHLINVKNGDNGFKSLISYLREKNNLDDSYWNEVDYLGKIADDDNEENIESFRPIYKEEFVRLEVKQKGIRLFTMIFVGLLFSIASGICLYYKVLLDIEDEKEIIISLNRIGVLQKEIKAKISKELAIIFFVPILIGGAAGMYFIYIVSFPYSTIVALIMKKSLIILLIGIVIQAIFYFISRKKYIREVMNNII